MDQSGVSIAELMARRVQLTGSDSPDLDVALLLCHCLDKPRSYLYSWPEKTLLPKQLAEFEALFSRRLKGEPLAHLLGQREFWSLDLAVNTSTLIPRPDTEYLVEQALARVSKDAGRILDLGTGTGAIALALAKELPNWQLLGVDCQPEAVALAQRNAQALALCNVSFQLSHWFSDVGAQRFEMIVSNPPYIAEDDPHLNEGDVRFEPRSALVAGKNGLADLETIIEQAPEYLGDGACLLLEHGYQQAAAVVAMLEKRGFSRVESRCDYAGNPRISLGYWFDTVRGER